MTQKLYKVVIRGGHNPGSTNYHESYVIASSTDAAYQAVLHHLDANDLCFRDQRELESITLLAEAHPYPKCHTMLFLVRQEEARQQLQAEGKIGPDAKEAGQEAGPE